MSKPPQGGKLTATTARSARPLEVSVVKADAVASASESNQLERKFRRIFKSESASKQQEYAHLAGLQDHYKHKSFWSYFLMAVMAFMVGFQSYLLYMVGSEQWDFTKYAWLLPVLLVQNLAQIVGLAVFVVKALFKEMD